MASDMVKDHSDSKRGNLLPHGPLFQISSKGSFICIIPDRIIHTRVFVTPVVEHWLERDIAKLALLVQSVCDQPLSGIHWVLLTHFFLVYQYINIIILYCSTYRNHTVFWCLNLLSICQHIYQSSVSLPYPSPPPHTQTVTHM